VDCQSVYIKSFVCKRAYDKKRMGKVCNTKCPFFNSFNGYVGFCSFSKIDDELEKGDFIELRIVKNRKEVKA
jgi:hypothetical protein